MLRNPSRKIAQRTVKRYDNRTIPVIKGSQVPSPAAFRSLDKPILGNEPGMLKLCFFETAGTMMPIPFDYIAISPSTTKVFDTCTPSTSSNVKNVPIAFVV